MFDELINQYGGLMLRLGGKLLYTLGIVLAGLIFIRLGGRIIQRAVKNLRFDETLGMVLKLILKYGIGIVGLIMALDAFGVNTTSLIAILGAAGVAIGLALKDTLSNIASGLLLLLLRLYRKGDFIEFGGCNGTVQNMDLFSTTLETPDGVYVSAPNSAIWGIPLKNYTRNGRRRMDLTVGVAYSDSLDTAFAVLREIAAMEPRFLKDPPPQVMLQSLGDSSVNITLRAWASVDTYWAIYWEQMRNIKEKIEAAGLAIPFPQRDVHLYKTS